METKSLTNWQGVGIGALIGMMFTALLFAITHSVQYDQGLYIMVAGLNVAFSIAGALVGKSKRKTWQAMWIGSIIGPLIFILLLVLASYVFATVLNGGY